MSSEETSQRILAAAGPVFAERGFQAATVREICDAAGVNLAAVNYYFGDKERLYLEAVKLARQTRAEQTPLPQWSPDTPTETKLRDFIRTILSRMLGVQEAPWEVRLMLREILQPTSACEKLVEQYFRPHFEVLLNILHEALPDDTPQHKRQQIGFSIIGQCFYYRVTGQVVAMIVAPEDLERHYTVEHLADHIADMSLAALGLGRPLGSGLKQLQ